jgi:Fur family ferric uptake transcriptional regulator
MTKAREAVNKVLSEADRPLSALEIGAMTEALCDTATVYRALHYLEEQGLAESFVLHCEAHGTERYYAARSSKHRHWFHCERCHRFVDLGTCTMGPLLADMAYSAGVAINHHTLYATGLCGRCRTVPA